MRSGKTEALERGTALRKALEELPDDQREVLVLRHLVGLSLDEIAGKFEMPTDAVAGLDQKAWRALETTGHPGGSQVVETLLIAELEQLSNQMD
jgi:RNA polymerase sigma factor (sigma-70 family)